MFKHKLLIYLSGKVLEDIANKTSEGNQGHQQLSEIFNVREIYDFMLDASSFLNGI
jgi:hypothetical protein